MNNQVKNRGKEKARGWPWQREKGGDWASRRKRERGRKTKSKETDAHDAGAPVPVHSRTRRRVTSPHC